MNFYETPNFLLLCRKLLVSILRELALKREAFYSH